MNIHEYQGKAVIKAFGANVSAGYPALTVAEAVEAAKKLPGRMQLLMRLLVASSSLTSVKRFS